MPNTVTNTRVVAGRDLVVQQVLLVSDGSEETDLVVYDSSALDSGDVVLMNLYVRPY